jgi:exosortase/archaeosortase family protein
LKEAIMNIGSRYEGVIWFALVGISILPLIGTINELLTKLALSSGLYRLLDSYVVPIMVRLTGTILEEVFRIETVISGAQLFVTKGGIPYEINIIWNCVGWQSFLLLIVIFITVFQGKYTVLSRVKSVALGLEGVLLVNLTRVTTTCLLLLRGGYGPALTFHDYFSTVLTFLWLSLFWYLTQNFILEYKTEDTKPFLRMVGDSLRGVDLASLLPDFIFGKKAIGLTTMVIIILATFLNGIAILSVRANDGGDQTVLSFEHLSANVTFNGINTDSIMTLPEYTDLGSTYSDSYTTPSTTGWYEMWDFYLYGPLGNDYGLQGSITYTVWLHIATQGVNNYDTQIRFKVYEVDETGTSTLVKIDTFSIKIKKNARQFQFAGGHISEHVFDTNHTMRVSISIHSDSSMEYVLEYDSSARHSNLDLPGMVVPERLSDALQLTVFFAATSFVSGRLRTRRMRRDKDE